MDSDTNDSINSDDSSMDDYTYEPSDNKQNLTATKQWLIQNYETAEYSSLPRASVYNNYLSYCSENKLGALNQAGFGKVVHSVFKGLKSRRLGVRGNTKYHYYGLRLKSGLHDDDLSKNNASQQENVSSQDAFQHRKFDQNYEEFTKNSSLLLDNTVLSSQLRYFEDNCLGFIPEFPQIDFQSDSEFPGDCTREDYLTFQAIYKEHLRKVAKAVVNFELRNVKTLWQDFWQNETNSCTENGEKKYLPKTKLLILCEWKSLQQCIKHVDSHFYQNLSKHLIPDALGLKPLSEIETIRNFGKNIELWLTQAIHGYPKELVHIKTTTVRSFSEILIRHALLSHISQALRPALQTHVSQMVADINKVDFNNFRKRVSWASKCNDCWVEQLETDFKVNLLKKISVEEWAKWLKNVFTDFLKPYVTKVNFASAAKQFFVKWSFYCSMLMNELTLKSANSIGCFHTIKMFFDEYLFYLTVNAIATETDKPMVLVIEDMLENPPDCQSKIILKPT